MLPMGSRKVGSTSIMCMIALRPTAKGRGANIPTQVIDTAVQRHPDGFGVAWREAGQLYSKRFGPAEKKAFRKTLKRVDRRSDIEYVAHFRMATHGPSAQSHAHPFEYQDAHEGRVFVFHNGIIDIDTETSESDTEVFVRDVLAHLPSRWWADKAITFLVEQSIGWSRLVLMTATETVNLQEKDGTWDGGLWYSSNHKPTTTYLYHGGKLSACDDDDWGMALTAAERAARKTWPIGVKSPIAIPAKTGEDAYLPDRLVGRPYQYLNGGHTLTAVKDIDRSKDGDWPESVMCDTCYTFGDVYCIDGNTYIDMSHRVGADAEADDAREEERSMDYELTEA